MILELVIILAWPLTVIISCIILKREILKQEAEDL